MYQLGRQACVGIHGCQFSTSVYTMLVSGSSMYHCMHVLCQGWHLQLVRPPDFLQQGLSLHYALLSTQHPKHAGLRFGVPAVMLATQQVPEDVKCCQQVQNIVHQCMNRHLTALHPSLSFLHKAGCLQTCMKMLNLCLTADLVAGPSAVSSSVPSTHHIQCLAENIQHNCCTSWYCAILQSHSFLVSCVSYSTK